MTLLFQVRTAVHVRLTRTYRTAAQSNRNYGPSPSDIRPVPRVIPEPGKRVVRRPSGSPGRKQREGPHWTEEMRQRQRELFPAGEHPTLKWAQNYPERYAEVRVEKAKAWTRYKLDQKFLDMIRGPRSTPIFSFSKKHLNYRLSLFVDKFCILFEGDHPEKGNAPHRSVTNVLLSFSPDGTTHPYAARHQQSHVNVRRDQAGEKRLNRIGIRVSGLHPVTGEPYVMWVPVGDVALERTLQIYDRIEDQEQLEALCKETYDRYVDNAKEEEPTIEIKDSH
ncbi:hypothetical protein BU17DRAFT_84456 [Hysterangium stoloniferum]|nr:hypothetical protein BU17DRAFT_84456 [Hysterangium stoloniferum]